MKHNLVSCGVYTETDWKSGLGSIIENSTWSGKYWNQSDVQLFKEEGEKKGWEMSYKIRIAYNEKMNIDQEFEELDLNKDIDFDINLAEKYINKYNNALERSIEFKLTLVDFRKLYKRKTCYYVGTEFGYEKGQDHRTLDRIDSEKGYTKENTVACIALVNNIKNSLFEDPDTRLRITKRDLLKLIKKLPDNY